VRCPQLAATRQTVVFGAGNADADLMFVGEAPGANEDREGLPFVGQAASCSTSCSARSAWPAEDVFVTNVLRCRPPGNRDPHPAEVDNCQDWLLRTVELVEPKVICSLGNFATKLLRRDPTGISRLHGRDEVQVLGCGGPACCRSSTPAARSTRARWLDTLRADFARIPELLALEAPDQPDVAVGFDEAPDEVGELLVEHVHDPAPEPAPDEPPAPGPSEPEPVLAEQMGLF
jgi:DNA polymerase